MTTQKCTTWCERYRPKTFNEFKGQEEAVRKVKFFLNNFANKKNRRRKKAVVLYGPAGIGKTSLAQVIANETSSEIFELNASDFRNKSKLQEMLKPAIEQKSLTKKNKLILIDEADGISGYYDKGGVPELLRIIDTTEYPIIITANDAWSKKLAPLRKKADMIELRKITEQIIIEIMIDILRRERLFMNYNILQSIAFRSKGDIRGAINDLQSVAHLRDPTKIEFSEREKETDIFHALREIFKQKPEKEMLRLFDKVNMPLDEIMLWIEENIPNDYHGEALAKAYKSLGKADLFKGRIYKQQYWRFLVYQNIFLSYAIAASKKEPNQNFTKYKKPDRILKIWLSNQKQFRKKSIAQKYAKYAHIGTKRAMNEFPVIKNIISSNTEIQKELRLNDEEVEYLKR